MRAAHEGFYSSQVRSNSAFLHTLETGNGAQGTEVLRTSRCPSLGEYGRGSSIHGPMRFEKKGSLRGNLTLVGTCAVGHPCGTQKELDSVPCHHRYVWRLAGWLGVGDSIVGATVAVRAKGRDGDGPWRTMERQEDTQETSGKSGI